MMRQPSAQEISHGNLALRRVDAMTRTIDAMKAALPRIAEGDPNPRQTANACLRKHAEAPDEYEIEAGVS